LNAVSTLFLRTLSQGLQAFAPVAVAWVWCSRAGDRRGCTLIARAAWMAALITVPGSWWFQRSATRALDEALLASVALAVAIAGGVIAWRTWRALATAKFDDAQAWGRGEFMALAGVFISTIFSIGILWAGLAPILTGLCEATR